MREAKNLDMRRTRRLAMKNKLNFSNRLQQKRSNTKEYQAQLIKTETSTKEYSKVKLSSKHG